MATAIDVVELVGMETERAVRGKVQRDHKGRGAPKRPEVAFRKLGTSRCCMLRDTDHTLITRLARASRP